MYAKHVLPPPPQKYFSLKQRIVSCSHQHRISSRAVALLPRVFVPSHLTAFPHLDNGGEKMLEKWIAESFLSRHLGKNFFFSSIAKAFFFNLNGIHEVGRNPPLE